MIDNELLQKIYPQKASEYEKTIDKMPTPAKVIITQQDVANKYVTRYFIRAVNDKTNIIEINKREYTKFNTNPRFIGCTLQWKIVGKKNTLSVSSGALLYGVEDTNRIAVSDVDLTFGGLRNYISDYLEHWFSED